MLKLKINDSDIELRRGEVVAISLQANSVEKPDTFQSSFSNSFDILLTRSNRNVLGNLFAMGNSGLEYERITGTSLVQDGLQIVSDGFAVVEEYNNQVATLTVYSGVNDFFAEIGDEKLKCLDFSLINPIWDLATVISSQTNNYTDGYIWAICNYGAVQRFEAITDVRFQHPSVFVKYLFLQIASQFSTYTWDESDYFIDNLFEKRILPFSNPKLDIFEGRELAGAWVINSEGNYILGNPEDDLAWSTDNGDAFTLGKVPISLAVGNKVFFEFDAEQIATITNSIFTFEIVAERFDGSTLVLATDSEITNTDIQFTVSADYEFPCDFNNNNEFRWVYLNLNIVFGTTGSSNNLSLGPGRFQTLNFEFGSEYRLPNSLPDWTCAEFIKNICLMFGLQIKADSTTKRLQLISFESYTTDYDNAIDFSDKVDISKEILVEPKFGNWAKENLFLFSEDETIEIPSFADGTLFVNAPILENEYKWIELGFAPSNHTDICASSSGIFTTLAPVYDPSNSPLVLDTELKPRIGTVSYFLSSQAVIALTDGTTTNNNVDFSVSKFSNDAFGEDLMFDGLYNDYFESFGKIIKEMQKLTVYLKLDAIDFNNIDFFVPYYLSFSYQNIQIRGYYILQLVDEYKAGETAKCEFIRLNPF